MTGADRVIDRFLCAADRGTLASTSDVLVEDAVADFSTVGRANGVGAIADLLVAPAEGSDVSWTTVTNVVHTGRLVYARAHHLHAAIDGATLHPFVHGGRIVFETTPAGDRIRSVSYALDYAEGNTAWVPGWDLRRAPATWIDAGPLTEPSREPVGSLDRFLWALDTLDPDLLAALAEPDVRYARTPVGGSPIVATGPRAAVAALAEHRLLVPGDQTSTTVTTVEATAPDVVRITGKRLNPADTGNKHRSARAVRTLFYDEVVEAELRRVAGRWRVSAFAMRHSERPVLPATALARV
jgi:hypothetical protein